MLFVSVLVPVIGAAGLFLWRPKDRRACHVWTMLFTLAASICAAIAIMEPSVQRVELLQLTPLLSVSFKLDGLGRIFSGMVALLWPLATLYAFEYMEHEGGENHFFGFYI